MSGVIARLREWYGMRVLTPISVALLLRDDYRTEIQPARHAASNRALPARYSETGG